MGAKKRDRLTNSEPFNPAGNDDSKTTTSSRKRSKAPKLHQQPQKVLSSGMSSKILKEALIQQKEIEEEEAREQNPNFVVFPEEPFSKKDEDVDVEEDIDDFSGFSETRSHFGGWEENDINEEDEKLLEAFMSKDNHPQTTLADIIVQRIKENDAQVSSEARPMPKFDESIIELYKGVGKLLSKYTSGKIPKAFKHIPSVQHWEEVLYLTEPEKWSSNAMFQAIRIFASNLGKKKAERFYKLVFLPRIREDIRKHKRLHFEMYQALRKSLYKPAAFNKGILFPLCESRTCTVREAVIIGSVIEKNSIPVEHSSVALLKLAEMEYYGTTSYFIKTLIEKKYSLPYRVLDALVAHFMRFSEETRIMPVIWHQSLLAFVQRYRDELRKEDKVNLNTLVKKQRHDKVTPEILAELNNSRNRGEKEDDLMSISTPMLVINKAIEEDWRDIPEVPMEED